MILLPIESPLTPEKTEIINYPKSGSYTYLLTTIEVIDKEIARFNVSGQTEIEDIRYKTELSNKGQLISADNIYIFKEYDINEQGIDWIYLNQKRKEMLLVRHDIFRYIGSYKSIINAINYFGYNDLELYEYYKDIDPTSDYYLKLKKIEIPNIFDNTVEGWVENDFIKNILPSDNYIGTNLFNLTYRITDREGNNILTYTLVETIVKLQGLKWWLHDNIIPLSHRILDICGRMDFVTDTTITHKTYDIKIINQRQEITPIDINIREKYLQPINSDSSVYVVPISFSILDIEKLEYFTINIKTYKTYLEWEPFKIYNKNDIVKYYDQLYKSFEDNNKLNTPNKWKDITEWDSITIYYNGNLCRYKKIIYKWTGSQMIGEKPIQNPLWLIISKWINIEYSPVQNIDFFKTDLKNESITIDSNIDPIIKISSTTENGWGVCYTIEKIYQIIGNSELNVKVVKLIN